MKYLLLDTFCGAGGCAMGYTQAGFEVVGVDIKNQPHYPFDFVQMDALEALRILNAGGYITGKTGRKYYLGDFAMIHASPPCQEYSKTKKIRGNIHPDLIGPVRDLLIATGKPYVIENVEGAPLLNPTLLTGTMFGLYTVRPRIFETSFELPFLMEPPRPKQIKMGRPVNEGDYIQVVGNFSSVSYARRAMGIDWMPRAKLSQAIPPAYTEWIGRQMIAILNGWRGG